MIPLTDMIPLSEIDKTIEKILDSETNYRDFEVVHILTNLSKKAIPAVSHEKINEKIAFKKEGLMKIQMLQIHSVPEWIEPVLKDMITMLEELKND
jgi:hypothetical protein